MSRTYRNTPRGVFRTPRHAGLLRQFHADKVDLRGMKNTRRVKIKCDAHLEGEWADIVVGKTKTRRRKYIRKGQREETIRRPPLEDEQ